MRGANLSLIRQRLPMKDGPTVHSHGLLNWCHAHEPAIPQVRDQHHGVIPILSL